LSAEESFTPAGSCDIENAHFPNGDFYKLWRAAPSPARSFVTRFSHIDMTAIEAASATGRDDLMSSDEPR
jgi:hypothetical protein